MAKGEGEREQEGVRPSRRPVAWLHGELPRTQTRRTRVNIRVVVMKAEKQRALEAAGWRFGDAAEFLEMTDEERQVLDVRVEAALAIRRQRKVLKLSQKQLASRIKTSQPRVAKIERAAADVSLDQMLRAFAAVGGRIVVRHGEPSRAHRATLGAAQARPGRKTVVAAKVAKVEIEFVGTEL
jgi:predicted XRE-type DNA-binding protein